MDASAKTNDLLRVVYELREAAVGYGVALAGADRDRSEGARDRLLESRLQLEEKTIAAIDECADSVSPAA